MGSCVSISEADPGSARFRLAMGSKAGEMLAPPPTIGGVQSGNGLPAGGMPEEAGLGLRNSRRGTKDETFFDSCGCFESDCEDDFFSVNGDLTPSCGNTPIHRMAAAPIKLQERKAVSVSDGLAEAKSEPSPRKTLAELLQETLPEEPGGSGHNTLDGKTEVNGKSEWNKTIIDQLPNSLDGATYISTRNGERSSADGNLGNGKEKRGKAKHCCLPSLEYVHSLSFNNKKPPSPCRRSGG